jgi:predicted nuclease of predicted toxin-antitoxin system
VGSIRFLLDEHVSHAIARPLRKQEIEVLTASDAGLLAASDSDYLAYSHSGQWVVVTRDDDFLVLHAQSVPHAGIAFCAQNTRSVRAIIAGLLLIYQMLDSSEIARRVEFL